MILLLKHGADIHILDRGTGMTLVHIAASKNTTPGIIKILIDSIFSDDSIGPFFFSLLRETEWERRSHTSYAFPQTPNGNSTLAYREDDPGNRLSQEQELQLTKLMELHNMVLYIY